MNDPQVVLKGLLGSLGFKVVRALSGDEALDLMRSRSHLPDLILLDVEMPKESGHEVWETVVLAVDTRFMLTVMETGLQENQEAISRGNANHHA